MDNFQLPYQALQLPPYDTTRSLDSVVGLSAPKLQNNCALLISIWPTCKSAWLWLYRNSRLSEMGVAPRQDSRHLAMPLHVALVLRALLGRCLRLRPALACVHVCLPILSFCRLCSRSSWGRRSGRQPH